MPVAGLAVPCRARWPRLRVVRGSSPRQIGCRRRPASGVVRSGGERAYTLAGSPHGEPSTGRHDVSITDPDRKLSRSRIPGTIERATVVDRRCRYRRNGAIRRAVMCDPIGSSGFPPSGTCKGVCPPTRLAHDPRDPTTDETRPGEADLPEPRPDLTRAAQSSRPARPPPTGPHSRSQVPNRSASSPDPETPTQRSVSLEQRKNRLE